MNPSLERKLSMTRVQLNQNSPTNFGFGGTKYSVNDSNLKESHRRELGKSPSAKQVGQPRNMIK